MGKISEQPPEIEIDATTYVLGIKGSRTVRILASALTPQSSLPFTELTDVDQDYTSDGGKLVRVKVTEDGLEFKGLKFTELLDTQANLNGQAYKYVIVNSSETGFIFSSTGGGAPVESVPALIVLSYKNFGGF
jgi:hypothetical protein